MPLAEKVVSIALYARLQDDTTIQGYVADRIYDINNVPDKPTRPYIVAGETISTPKDTLGNTGSDIVSTFHIWSNQRGKEEVLTIQDAMHDLLHEKEDEIILTGHKCASIRNISNSCNGDNSSGEKIMHGVSRYRTWTQEAI